MIILKGLFHRSGLFRALLVLSIFAIADLRGQTAADEPREFDIPAGAARERLRQFAAQARKEIVFSVETVEGVQTNAVKGRMTAPEALGQMLSATDLTSDRDGKTGAFAIRKKDVAAKNVASRPAVNRAAPANSASTNEEAESPVVLSPFVVSAEEDEGYMAQHTLAGTRIRTDIRDVGSSISVITSKFLQDTGTTNATELLVYTPNTEIVGPGGNYLGAGDDINAGAVRYGSSRVRGLVSADNTRDFFLTDIPWDTYNTGRIDIQRGPNSVLFGIGSPAGIINASVNHAAFKDAYEIENKIDNFGRVRFSADLNKEIIDDELAVRLSLLNDETKYRQDPAFRDDRRIFAAMRWDPRFLNRGSVHTSLTATYERGEIESNLPRQAPPNDFLTPWFLDPQLVSVQEAGIPFRTGTNVVNPRSFFPLATAAGDQLTTGGTITTYMQGVPTGIAYPHNISGHAAWVGGAFHQGIHGYAAEATKRKLPGWTGRLFKNRVITDRSIFDSYENLLDGDTKGEFINFDALTIAFRQSFLEDTLGYELAFDQQNVHSGQQNFLGASGYGIAVDVMGTYGGGIIGGSPNPAGGTFAERADPVNPLLGRAYVVGARGSSWNWNRNEKTTYRATGFYNLDFKKISGSDSTLGRLFGENRFTLLASRYQDENFGGNGGDFYTDNGYVLNIPGNPYYQTSRTPAYALYYLTETKLTGNDPSGINLPRMSGLPQVGNQRTNVRLMDPTTKLFYDASFDLVHNSAFPERERQYGGASRSRSTVDSAAVVWQGYWFGGTVIPMAAIRRDEAWANNGTGLPRQQIGNQTFFNPFDPNFRLGPDGPKSRVDSKTYSVVTHLPSRLRERLPGRLDVQLLFNQSENFQPSPGRIDIQNRPIDDPVGRTKEYGVAISALDNKLYFKVARYETIVRNAQVGSNSNINAWRTAEVWARSAAASYLGLRSALQGIGPTSTDGKVRTIYGYAFGDTTKPVFFRPYGPYAQNTPFNQTTGLQPNVWDGRSNGLPIWGGGNEPYAPGTVRANYTQEELNATWEMQQAAALAVWENPPDDAFIAATGINPATFFSPTGPGFATGADFVPSAQTAQIVGTTESKGTEFELIANPIRGLHVQFNASKTEARRYGMAPGFLEYVESRKEFLAGAAGKIRFFSGSQADGRDDPYSTSGNADLRNFFNTDVYQTVARFVAAENGNAPELKPWAFNVIANYSFQGDGPLKGFNVGGGYRWLDKNIVGYPVIVDQFGAETYDIGNPYYGHDQGNTDLWLGYQRRFGRNFNWRIQLNVRNVFANDKLILESVNPDGSGAGYRIPEPRTFTLTNTIEF